MSRCFYLFGYFFRPSTRRERSSKLLQSRKSRLARRFSLLRVLTGSLAILSEKGAAMALGRPSC
jgi:hypothetical protein